MCPGGLPLSGTALFTPAIDWQLTHLTTDHSMADGRIKARDRYSLHPIGRRANQGAARRHIDSHG